MNNKIITVAGFALCCVLAGCGPGVIAAATVLSGFDAGENLLHDGPDLFQCGHVFGGTCPPDTKAAEQK